MTQVGERVWLVTFMRYDLGYFDDGTCRLEPIENPFSPKVFTHVSGMDLEKIGSSGWIRNR